MKSEIISQIFLIEFKLVKNSVSKIKLNIIRLAFKEDIKGNLHLHAYTPLLNEVHARNLFFAHIHSYTTHSSEVHALKNRGIYKFVELAFKQFEN